MNATEPREKLLNHSCQAVLLRGIVGLLMVNAGSGGSVSFINELFLCKITPGKNYK